MMRSDALRFLCVLSYAMLCVFVIVRKRACVRDGNIINKLFRRSLRAACMGWRCFVGFSSAHCGTVGVCVFFSVLSCVRSFGSRPQRSGRGYAATNCVWHRLRELCKHCSAFQFNINKLGPVEEIYFE